MKLIKNHMYHVIISPGVERLIVLHNRKNYDIYFYTLAKTDPAVFRMFDGGNLGKLGFSNKMGQYFYESLNLRHLKPPQEITLMDLPLFIGWPYRTPTFANLLRGKA